MRAWERVVRYVFVPLTHARLAKAVARELEGNARSQK